MQTKVISSEVNDGVTRITIRTPYGDFTGEAKFNAEKDKFSPSLYVGTEIAEARAYILAINELIKRKKEQIKGIKRLEFSCDSPDKKFYTYINHAKRAIYEEISNLSLEKGIYQHRIDSAIEARGIFIRSRTIPKEEKQKYLEGIGEAIKNLGQMTSKEKKEN